MTLAAHEWHHEHPGEGQYAYFSPLTNAVLDGSGFWALAALVMGAPPSPPPALLAKPADPATTSKPVQPPAAKGCESYEVRDHAAWASRACPESQTHPTAPLPCRSCACRRCR